MPAILDREEHIDQAYFFRTLRERMFEERRHAGAESRRQIHEMMIGMCVPSYVKMKLEHPHDASHVRSRDIRARF